MCFSLSGTFLQGDDVPASSDPVKPFLSRAPKARSAITNKVPNKLCKDIDKVNPTAESPFPSGIVPRFPEKRKMLPPIVSKSQERRAEKDRKEREAQAKQRPPEKSKNEPKEKKKTPEELVAQKLKTDIERYLKLPPREIGKHAGAAIFPGDIAQNQPRVNKSYTSDNEIRGWQCSGLYAPPGEIIRMHSAKAGVNSGYKIRIGCHTDDLRSGTQKDTWSRFPVVTREFSVDNDTIELASPFGGMIYIFAPEPPKKQKIVRDSQPRIPQRVRFQFIGVVEAPVFELGETTTAEWDYLKNAPAPWAEFSGKYFSATIPAWAVREIKNPAEIIGFWDKIISEQDKFVDLKKAKTPKERIVFDVDSTKIGGHSGEVIVCPLQLVKTFLDLPYIREHGSWGLFFYLAKNRVRADWTLYGNSDVGAAIVALRSMEQATGKMPGAFFDVPALNASALGEPKFAGTPELIGAYILPIEVCGWEPLYKTFSIYNNAKKPPLGTEIDKYESFFAIWSRAAKVNFGSYFEKFGFQYSARQKNRLEKLKPFEPKNFPPDKAVVKHNPSGYIGDMPLGNIDCFFDDYNPAEDNANPFIDKPTSTEANNE